VIQAFDPSVPLATNEEVARVLFQLASLLDLMQENPYRVRAYRRAGLGVLLLPRQLAEYVAENEELPLPGIGERMRRRLMEIVNTGHMGVYETVLEDLGEPMVSLLAVRGIGPRTAIRLMRELQIGSLQDLVAAANDGRIRGLRGFGPKREAQLGEQAEALLQSAA
jgi:DNA polymerase (family 10)